MITGKAGGRKLKSVPGDTTRPITDRAKEALFNILAGDVIDSNWWDLFAGTGAVGIEALSRGAAFVRFSDMNRAPIETIAFNVEHCGFKIASRDPPRRCVQLSQPAAGPAVRIHLHCAAAIQRDVGKGAGIGGCEYGVAHR